MPISVFLDKPVDASDKSSSASTVTKRNKRVRRKKVTQLGALLPDTIHIGNHMITSRMSNEEFKSRCSNLSAKCTSVSSLGKDCNAHISKRNLERISNNFNILLNQSENITPDWEKRKELDLGNQGYLNLAANFPEIMKEISNIKQLINSFNKGRRNIW